MADAFTRRDIDMLKMQQELLRRASLTAPETTLGGEDLMLLRKFAQETLPIMRALYATKFRDVTVETWLNALQRYVASRRPEFRREIMAKVKTRYADQPPKGKPSEVLAAQAAENIEKKAEKKDRPSLAGSMARGAATIGALHTLVRSPYYVSGYKALRKQGLSHMTATRYLLKAVAGNAKMPALVGAAGGLIAHPFALADWRKREGKKQ